MPDKSIWWYQLLNYLASAGGGTLIALFLLKAWRYKQMDNAKVSEKLAQIAKLKVETDISIVSEYRVLVQALKKELDEVRNYSDALETELVGEKKKCDELEDRLRDALNDIRILKRKIDELEKKINKQ